MGRGMFIFCVCGDEHVARVEVALRFLKRVTRADIVVIAGRSRDALSHDQVLRVSVPHELSDHQASVYLKTALPTLVGSAQTCCYVDSDQIATSNAVDDIFELYEPPVTFARDRGSIDEFSRYAVNCSCTSGECVHLRAAIRERFNVTISDGTWRHWNGGLYLFDDRSRDFCVAWHQNTLLVFEDTFWRVRDQGTLIATAWQQGLQNHATLPQTVTRIVDRYFGHPPSQRPALGVDDYFVDRGYRLGVAEQPAFLHFINDGVNAHGWANWDEADALPQTQ
jgi:hypothetical protein